MWLRCEIREGQFDGEYSVSGDTIDGAGFSLFLPTEFVASDQHISTDSVPGWVKVEVLDSNDDCVLVKLPRHTLENGATVTVSADDIEDSPIYQDA